MQNFIFFLIWFSNIFLIKINFLQVISSKLVFQNQATNHKG
jgi:hypothetical protein